MHRGDTIRRESDKVSTIVQYGSPGLQGEHWRDGLQHATTIETVGEGCRLMHAWDVQERAVLVFVGAESGQLFIPSHEDRAATDWDVEP